MLSAAYRCVNLMKTKSMSAHASPVTAKVSVSVVKYAQQRLQFGVVDQAGRVTLN
jgi:hypothetical protein